MAALGAPSTWKLPALPWPVASTSEASPAPAKDAPSRAPKRAEEGAQAKRDGATPASEPAAATPAKTADDPIVYVAMSGSTYHRAGCGELGGDRISLPVSDARADYTACRKCSPPK